MNRLRKNQEGAALGVGLILLVIITLMGYTGMKGTMLQEKMAAGLNNRSLANTGANSALRNGELFLYRLVEVTNGVNVKGTPDGSFNNIYTRFAVIGDSTSGENPILTEFKQRNWVSTNGTEHTHDFSITDSNAGLNENPQYLIFEDSTLGCDGDSGGFGTGCSANRHRTFVVVGKSQSGDGRSISIMESLFTAVVSSDATN